MKVVTDCAAAGGPNALAAMTTSSEAARLRNQQLLPAAPGESGEPVSARATLGRELRELPDGPGEGTSYRGGEKSGGGVKRFSGQPELRPEPETEDLITKDLRNLKPFRNIPFFLRHHMG